MGAWLISRLLSYVTLFEFFDQLAEYSARGLVTVKGYILPSEYVDIVDDAVPVVALILRELLLLAVILGLFFCVAYAVAKGKRIDRELVWTRFGKLVLGLGVLGFVSRIATIISVTWFLNREYYQYYALEISITRDLCYTILGIMLILANRNERKVTSGMAVTHAEQWPLEKEQRTDAVDAQETDKPILYCRKCGSKLEADSIFCSRCGIKIV